MTQDTPRLMMMQDTPRLMMITGGNRGIGLSIAQEAQARGWRVCLGLRDAAQLPAGLDPAMTDLFQYDATNRDAEAAWVDHVTHTHGRIDAIVANAGLFTSASIIDASEADVDGLLEVNLRAPRRLAIAAWPLLKASGQGRVAILASLSGKRVATKGSALYSVTKFAAIGLAHALRYEGWEDGIRATAICPGLVATDMGLTASNGTRDAAEMTQPGDVAKMMLEVIELSNTASVAEFHINCRADGLF